MTKIITRLKHDAREMKDSIFGWDIFRCRDYSNVDGMVNNLEDMKSVKPILGYTIIFALNLKGRRFFKRLFIKTT